MNLNKAIAVLMEDLGVLLSQVANDSNARCRLLTVVKRARGAFMRGEDMCAQPDRFRNPYVMVVDKALHELLLKQLERCALGAEVHIDPAGQRPTRAQCPVCGRGFLRSTNPSIWHRPGCELIVAIDKARAVYGQAPWPAVNGRKTRTCRVCGCTDDHACPGGCYWVELDLCSACVGAK